MNPVTAVHADIYQGAFLSNEFKTLFNDCPPDQPILKAAESIMEMTNMTAPALQNTIRGAYNKEVDTSHVFEDDTRLNRVAQVIFQTLISTEGVQKSIDRYSEDENNGIFASLTYCASYATTPITASISFVASIPPLSWALSIGGAMTRFASSLIFSEPQPPVNCDSEPTQLSRDEYTFCMGSQAYFAERKVLEAKEQCPNLLKESVQPIATEHLKTLGAFLVAAENNDVSLSFDPNHSRQDWQKRFREKFCMKHVEHADCKLGSAKSVDEWKDTAFTAIQDTIPAKIANEIQQLQPENLVVTDHNEL